MNVRVKAILPILFFIFSGTQSTWSQTTRSNTRNTNAWLMYFGNHKFAEKWGWHAEIQWRRHDVFSENQQLLLRTGVDFYMSGNNRLTTGYGYIRSYPYGEFGAVGEFPEHRLWQQFLTTHKVAKANLAHRYRLEQRWIGTPVTSSMNGGRYENRIRYMAKITLPIGSVWKTPLFIALYDEVMINFGKEVANNIFDQNRLYGALGSSFSDNLRLEVGYLYQVVQLRGVDDANRNRIENNHTLQFGLFSTIPFM